MKESYPREIVFQVEAQRRGNRSTFQDTRSGALRVYYPAPKVQGRLSGGVNGKKRQGHGGSDPLVLARGRQRILTDAYIIHIVTYNIAYRRE